MAGPAAAGVGREYYGMAPFPARCDRATIMGWLYLSAGLPPWEVLWDAAGRRRGCCGTPGGGCSPSQASWRCPPGPPRGAPVRPRPPLPPSVGANKAGRVLWDGAGVGGWLPWCVSRGWLLWDGVAFVNYYGMRGGAERGPPPPGAARREDGNVGMRRVGTQPGAVWGLPAAPGLHRNPRPSPQRAQAAGSRLPSQANSDPSVGREQAHSHSNWGCEASQHLTCALVPSVSFLGRNLPSKSKCHKVLTSKFQERAQGWHKARHVLARSIPEQSLICDPCFLHQGHSPTVPGLALA